MCVSFGLPAGHLDDSSVPKSEGWGNPLLVAWDVSVGWWGIRVRISMVF